MGTRIRGKTQAGALDGTEAVPLSPDSFATTQQIADLGAGSADALISGFPFTVAEVTQIYEGNPVTYRVMFFHSADFVPLAWAITGDANPRVCFVNDPSGGVLFLGDGTFEPYSDSKAAFIGWDGSRPAGTLRVGPNLNVLEGIFTQDLSIAGSVFLANLNALPQFVGLLDPTIRNSDGFGNSLHVHNTGDNPNTIPAGNGIFELALSGASSGNVRVQVTGAVLCDDIDAATISTANIQSAFDSGIAPGAFSVVENSADHWEIEAIAPPYSESLRLATFADNCTPPATLTQLNDGRALGFAGDIGDITLTPVGLFEKTGSADTDWSRLVPIPAGGTTGQVLTKASNADYDFVWS